MFEEQFDYFWAHNEDLTYRSTAVYMALLDIQKKCQKHPFMASDKQIMKKAHIKSANTFSKAKKELIAKGFIYYVPSHTIGVASVYAFKNLSESQ